VLCALFGKFPLSMFDNEITQHIIGGAIEVHKQLGPGLLESAYEECLCHELAIRNINFEKQKPIPLVYKETK
jgi:GxxExxY protein